MFSFFQGLLKPLFLTPVDDPILKLTSNGYSKPFVNITDIDDFNINIPSVSRILPTKNTGQDKDVDESEDFLQLSEIFDKPITDSRTLVQNEPCQVSLSLLEEEAQLTDSEDTVLVLEVEIEPDDLKNFQKITDSGETIKMKVEQECSEYLPINKENGLQIIDSRSLVKEECDINEYSLKNQEVDQEVIDTAIVIQPEQGQITDSESGKPNLKS